MEGFTDNRPNKNPRMKHLFIGALALLVALHGGAAYGQKAKQKQKSASVNVLANDTRVFKVDPAIDVQGVRFKNRFGIELAGHLYMPKGYEASKRYPAVAVCGPFGAVKEQASGLYAQELASRGFVALAFDPSFTGESGGEVRSVAAPDINTEDFGAAVDYLIRLRNVDVSKIGLVGIGGWGGMAVNEASVDTRVKATVICSFYDMKRLFADVYYDSKSDDARYEELRRLSNQRTRDAQTDTHEVTGDNLDRIAANAPRYLRDFQAYYKSARGFHKRSVNSTGGWTKTTPISFIGSPLCSRVGEIRGAVLIVQGEKSHTRGMAEDIFKRLNGSNKELYIVPGAYHIDLYDDMKRIPFDIIDRFLKEYLK